MPQLRYKFVRVEEIGRTVILRKIPDGFIGEFLDWFGKGGQEFSATIADCQEILDDIKHYEGTSYAGAANSENNREQVRRAMGARWPVVRRARAR